MIKIEETFYFLYLVVVVIIIIDEIEVKMVSLHWEFGRNLKAEFYAKIILV